MTLGALLDLGVPVEVVGEALDAIGAGRDRLRITKVVKHGITATDLKVSTEGSLGAAVSHTHSVSSFARLLGKVAVQVRVDDPEQGKPTSTGDAVVMSLGALARAAVEGAAAAVSAAARSADEAAAPTNGDHTLPHDGSDAASMSIADAARAALQGAAKAVFAHARDHAQDPTARSEDDKGPHGDGGTTPGAPARRLSLVPPHTDDEASASSSQRATEPAAAGASEHSPEHASVGAPEHADANDHVHDHVGVHVHEHVNDHVGDHDHDHHDHSHGQSPVSDTHSHAHSHDHSHAHHHYGELRARIVAAALTPGTKQRALDIFDRLARAEAKIHGKTVEDVVFHEVGAIDSVVDIVGTAAALDWLDPKTVTCTGVAMGHGTIVCAHGVLPVPAPAALEVLVEAKGVMTSGGLPRELCTPTGAAILAATVTSWTPAPTGTPLAIGWGAGDADLRDRANVLRATVIQPSATAGTADTVWQIDANLDDMSPELCAPAAEAVFGAGALDVWWTPITMKKGRPALTLSALVETAKRDAVIDAILRETTTIGVRYSARERTVLARSMVEVETRYGTIRIKVSSLDGTAVNAAPEYEECAAAARRFAVPVKHVYAAALAAYDARVAGR